MKKISFLLMLCSCFFSTIVQSQIFKLDCKHGQGFLGDGNKNYQSTTWYINFEKKKVALGKINNNKVKYVSETWKPSKDNTGLNKSGGIRLGDLKININGVLYMAALHPRDKEGKGREMQAYAFSQDGLEKNPQYKKYEKQLAQLAKTMGKNKKDYETYLKVDKERLGLLSQYTITQNCSVPIEVKSGKSNLKDKIKKGITDLVK